MSPKNQFVVSNFTKNTDFLRRCLQIFLLKGLKIVNFCKKKKCFLAFFDLFFFLVKIFKNIRSKMKKPFIEGKCLR